MRAEDLRQLIERQPFPVLRLHLAGGMIFEIRDSDQPVVTRTTVEVLLPPDGGQGREAVISLLQISWVEVVTPAD
jgi:hypothetical protein